VLHGVLDGWQDSPTVAGLRRRLHRLLLKLDGSE
jgi:hypothetical protein